MLLLRVRSNGLIRWASTFTNTTSLSVLKAIGAAVSIRLLKRDL